MLYSLVGRKQHSQAQQEEHAAGPCGLGTNRRQELVASSLLQPGALAAYVGEINPENVSK